MPDKKRNISLLLSMGIKVGESLHLRRRYQKGTEYVSPSRFMSDKWKWLLTCE